MDYQALFYEAKDEKTSVNIPFEDKLSTPGKFMSNQKLMQVFTLALNHVRHTSQSVQIVCNLTNGQTEESIKMIQNFFQKIAETVKEGDDIYKVDINSIDHSILIIKLSYTTIKRCTYCKSEDSEVEMLSFDFTSGDGTLVTFRICKKCNKQAQEPSKK